MLGDTFRLISFLLGIQSRYFPSPAAASVGGGMKHYSWFEIYRAAMVELDSSKIPERLMLAREKLKQRMQMAGLDDDEQQADCGRAQ
jgi:hypothetical protein